jgi:hypothetical protein
VTALSLLADEPAKKVRVPTRESLTPETFSKFQALILPQENERGRGP